MTEERLREIFEEDSFTSNLKGDKALQGLNILAKYFPGKTVLGAAEHDIIYSCDVNEIIAAGITEEDALELKRLNWILDTEVDCLACFV